MLKFPLRRTSDQLFTRWRTWAGFAIGMSIAFLAGQMLQTQASEKAQNIVTSFAGGALAIVLVWGGMAKQIFDNWEKVAVSRQEVNEELEHKITESEARYQKQIAEMEARYQAQIAEMETRHHNEMTALRTQLSALQAQYEGTVIEKVALQSALAQAHAQSKQATPKAPRILIVDDDPDICAVNSYLLRAAGFDVEKVESAVEAMNLLEKSASAPFDLVITDFAMPRLNGEEMINIIRTLGSTVKMAIYTGHGKEMTGDFAAKHDVPVWEKPLANDELVRRVKALVGGA